MVRGHEDVGVWTLTIGGSLVPALGTAGDEKTNSPTSHKGTTRSLSLVLVHERPEAFEDRQSVLRRLHVARVPCHPHERQT